MNFNPNGIVRIICVAGDVSGAFDAGAMTHLGYDPIIGSGTLSDIHNPPLYDELGVILGVILCAIAATSQKQDEAES